MKKILALLLCLMLPVGLWAGQASQPYSFTNGTTADGGEVQSTCEEIYSKYNQHDTVTTGVHGITGTIVGTSETQTLTNKTLTSPTMTTPTLGAATATTLNTGQGAYELYKMDQNVDITGTPSFQEVTISTAPTASTTAKLNFTRVYAGSTAIASIQAGVTNANNKSMLAFYTGATTMSERMRIDDTGNVGIGATTPTSPASVETFMEVAGARAGLVLNDTGAEPWEIFNDNGGLNFIYNNSGTAVFDILASGILYNPMGIQIGAYASNNQIDDGTNGTGSTTLYIGNETIDTSVSDERLKTKIEPSKINIMALISKMQVKDFDWLADNPRSKKGKGTGLIAQEVYEYLPQVIKKTDNPKDNWAVEYNALVPYLILAIQEQQKTISKQGVDIKNLNDKIINMEQRLAKLERK